MDIGNVIIKYDETGKVVLTQFKPATKTTTVGDKLLEQLKTITGSSDQETIRNNAQLAFASWFNSIVDMELADRDVNEIKTSVVHCEKYDSGMIKVCEIKFTFEKVN